MDRKKKLETSLEGLFSKTKGSEGPEEKKVITPEPIPPEEENKPASTAAEKKPRKPEVKTEAKPPAKKAVEDEVQVKKEVEAEQKPVEAVKPTTQQEPLAEKNEVAKETEKVAPEILIVAPVEPAPKPIIPVEPIKKTSEKMDLARSDNDLITISTDIEGEIKLLIFEINQVAYAIDVSMVQTIIKPQAVFIVPGTVSYLTGLINLRGEVVPVIDLRTRFGLESQEATKDTRFVVVRVNDIMASMVVDCVHGVETVPLNVIEKPSGLVMDIDNRYLMSMARYSGQIVLILDLLQTIQPYLVEQR